jgi:uncharacterized BrkB/YihY/UPF0761 family membrane protein
LIEVNTLKASEFAILAQCRRLGGLTNIASNSGRALSSGIVVGIQVSLWSAMSGVKAMIDALNVIYEQPQFYQA